MAVNTSNLNLLLNLSPQQNMSDKIFTRISELIRSGELPEGYVFPNETILCEQLGIGRSTIREAYKALELAGYVTRSKRGTIVNSSQTILGATPLKSVVSQSSSQDFLEFRLMLEGETASLAAARASSDEVQKLQEILTNLEEADNAKDYSRMNDLDRDFHESIATATHNPMMITSMAAVSEIWSTETKRNFYNAAAHNPAVFARMHTQHQEILDAIRNQDSAKASQLMKAHIAFVSS